MEEAWCILCAPSMRNCVPSSSICVSQLRIQRGYVKARVKRSIDILVHIVCSQDVHNVWYEAKELLDEESVEQGKQFQWGEHTP